MKANNKDHRNKQIYIDFVENHKSRSFLARKHNLSLTRINQILEKERQYIHHLCLRLKRQYEMQQFKVKKTS